MSSVHDKPESNLVMAAFRSPDALIKAARTLREKGFKGLDAYSSFPLHGIEEALGTPKSKIPLMVLIAGLSGACGGYGLQYWVSTMAYQINVGGRPLHSPLLNVPVTFECGILLGALTAVFGTIALAGLPRYHHPVFENEAFRSVSLDRYWISADAKDGELEGRIKQELQALGAEDISVVPQ